MDKTASPEEGQGTTSDPHGNENDEEGQDALSAEMQATMGFTTFKVSSSAAASSSSSSKEQPASIDEASDAKRRKLEPNGSAAPTAAAAFESAEIRRSGHAGQDHDTEELGQKYFKDSFLEDPWRHLYARREGGNE